MENYEERRTAAVERLKARRDFKRHVIVYVVVNLFLIGIWALAGGGYFWPIWPILGWGIAVVFNAYDVYARKPITEEDIQREMERGGG